MQLKKIGTLLGCAAITGLLAGMLSFGVFAEEAADITKQIQIQATGLTNVAALTDGSLSTTASAENFTLTISSETPIGCLYIKYREVPSQGALNGSTPIASYGFLHEYIPLDGGTKAVLSFPKANIAEIYAYGVGDLPEEVQVWQVGPEGTDLMLFATHSDDDQLFFAGLIPYYTDRGVIVRVAYFVNHFDTYNRTHELLDGLWHCGLKNYPIISPLPDGYSESEAGAQEYLQKQGFGRENVLNLQRIFLTRYTPKVAVLHDIDGEYGHGAHILNTATFLETVEKPSEGLFLPEKIYIHLYKENPLTLDIDSPLESFGGKTAFQVSQEAFRFHKSQHWTWFYNWLYGKNGEITKASQIKSYNPAKYGLYYSSVGPDSGNDMLENVKTYGEIQAEEEERRAELQRQEEQRRLQEKEQYEADTSRLEQEAREAEQLAAEQRQAEKTRLILSFSLFGAAVLVAILLFFVLPKRPRKRKKPIKKELKDKTER